MSKDWFNREVLMRITQVFMISLDLTLLAIPGYFSINDLPDTVFGLQGAIVNGTFVSYSFLVEKCSLTGYCGKIAGFHKGGQTLLGLICIDIIVLIFVILMNLILTTLVKQIILDKESVSRPKRIMLKVLAFNNHILFLHPIVVNSGFIAWIIVSKFTQLSDRIVLREGLIILIVQSFLSWLSIAYNIWIITSSKRRNLRILKAKDYKKEDLSISL